MGYLFKNIPPHVAQRLIIIYLGENKALNGFFLTQRVHVSVVSYSTLEVGINSSYKINPSELLQGINMGVMRYITSNSETLAVNFSVIS